MKKPGYGLSGVVTITKESEERKDRGVAARQSVPSSHVQRTSAVGCDTVLLDRALFRSAWFRAADQNKEFCFDVLRRCLYSVARLSEEFPDHCNTFINSQLFIGFSEPER